jgi:hypothetical protein
MSIPADPPKALSYVPQIKEVLAELGRANTNKLQCAIKLGGLLHDAKDALGKKGNWMEFRAAHFREISHSTANVYMQLAKYKDLLDDPGNSQRAVNSLVEKDLSIRGALEAMERASKSPAERARADAERKAKKAEREAARIANAEAEAERKSSTDPAAILEDLDPSEVLDAITDKDKKAELLKRQLAQLHPYRVLDLLAEAWANDAEYLPQLGEAIAERLKSHQSQTVKRRPLGDQPQASV